MDKKHAAAMLAAVLLIAALVLAALARGEREASSDSFHLGTFISMRVYGKNPWKLKKQLAEAEAEIVRLEGLFSANMEDSEVSRACASAGQWAEISYDTAELAARSLDLARMTHGAFDPTIGAAVKLWGIGTPDARVPSSEETARALAASGHKKVLMSDRKGKYFIKVPEGMVLDFGAIAKGYIADVLTRKLAKAGVKSALLNLGGNVAAVGSAPDGKPWHIGIQHPGKARGEYIGYFSVKDASVVTSGAYERYFEADGVRYCHIFDPATGFPAESDIASITIADEDSAFADAVCTAIFVMGRETALTFLSRHPDIAAAIVEKDGNKIYVTPAAKKIFTLTDKTFTLEDTDI